MWTFPNAASPACSAPQNLTITNSGGELAQGLNLTLPLAEFTYVSDDCPADLPYNQSCTLTMQFCPSSAGPKSDQIQINYTSSQEGAKSASIMLSGTGL
jgi:hypothetical protein